MERVYGMKNKWLRALVTMGLVVTNIFAGCYADMAAGSGASLTTPVYAAENEEVDMDKLLDMDELYGWAAAEGTGLDTVTGGGDAVPQVVTTIEELTALAGDDIPRVIVIDGRISTNALGVSVGSNKTIVGMDDAAQVTGGFHIENASNIIINNLNIKGTWPYYGVPDCVELKNSHHVWLNHLSVWNATDGNMDITMGSDYVTVSWCKFWYTGAAKKKHTHRLSCLVSSGTGHDDTDMDKLRVTFHHNWFADGVYERMPRVMYGRVHMYNNYYSSEDNDYCIGADCYASILVENNYFENVNNPHEFSYDAGFPAAIVARGNQYVNTTGSRATGQHQTNASVVPFEYAPYDYWLNAAADVPDMVQSYTGPKNDLGDASLIPAGLRKGQMVKGIEQKIEIPSYTGSFELEETNSLNDNPIAYDEATDTYTMQGQNSDGSNGYYQLDNPFAGYDFEEEWDGGVPYWEKGVTISYWIKLPWTAMDAAVLNFNLENDRQMERNDAAKYEMCRNYSVTDESYSLGVAKTYMDAAGKTYTVLSGYGENVCYNPLYPTEGCYYATSAGGAIRAYEVGTSASNPSNWTYLNYIGEGYYENYGARFFETGGEKSRIKETNVSGSLSLYASGSVGYRQDNWRGRQMNPNLPSYGSVLAAQATNQLYYWGNGGDHFNIYGGDIPPTVEARDEWHFVVAVIQNDWIQYYMDGIEMDTEYFLNWWDRKVEEDAAGDSFNRGFGHKMKYRVLKTPAKGYQNGKTILDLISDERTVLTVGGMGAGAASLGQDTIGTPDGVQVRDIEYYYVPAPYECILPDGIDLSLAPYLVPAQPKEEQPSEPEERMAGDIDGDGKVRIQDAFYGLKAALRAALLNEKELQAGDMDGDGVIGLPDVQAILRMALFSK